MHVRELATIEDCKQVAALEREVWGYTDSEDVVPAPVLIVSIKRGGILLGGFDEAGTMKGFVYSMAGVRDGRLMQWSHMLGVASDARNSGLGRELKLTQRERALKMGVELVEWTFDPLQALNAHFNFARLGVVVEEYEENVYGDSSSPLHHGSPTDRFIAEWRHFGRPSGVVIRNNLIYVADSESNNPGRNPGWLRGIRIGTLNDGKVTHRIPDPQELKGTSAAEGIAVDARGNIYGAEVGPRQMVKHVRAP